MPGFFLSAELARPSKVNQGETEESGYLLVICFVQVITR